MTTLITAAKETIADGTFKSFIITKNSHGPNFVPCGTPARDRSPL